MCLDLYKVFGAESFENLQVIHQIGSAESLSKVVIK
jgi:hypothetical protein